jgi:branched-chain amino acid transport system ATP-binding protein
MSLDECALAVDSVVKRFGGFTAVSNLSLTLNHGERLALIGPNGAGKSTIVNLMMGVLRPDSGTINMFSRDVTQTTAWQRSRMGLARTFQIPRPFKTMTVRENVEIALSFSAGLHGGERLAEEATKLLALVDLASKGRALPQSLSQVELRKLELARALAVQPKVLIADEVMAGLSDFELDEILDLLLKFNADGIAIVMIEHIMRAVVRFAERIVVVVAGSKIADGAPDAVLADPEVERVYLGQ